MEYLAVGWEQMYEMCIRLTEKIKKARLSPDLIVGVARGGWIPARVISDLLHNPNLASIRVEFYEDVGRTGREPRITQPLSVSVEDRKVLVVDDVADTGHSLFIVNDYLRKVGAKIIKTATIHYKPHSIFKPNFYVDKTNAWIIYPHERFEFILSYIKNNLHKGYTLNNIVSRIEKIGLNQPYVRQLAAEAWSEFCHCHTID